MACGCNKNKSNIKKNATAQGKKIAAKRNLPLVTVKKPSKIKGK